MKVASVAAAAAALFAVGQAASLRGSFSPTLIFTNNSNLVGPGISDGVFELDTTAWKAKDIIHGPGLNDVYSYVSAATVCGEGPAKTYYVAGASPAYSFAGVVAVNLNNGTKMTFNTYQSNSANPHALACNPSDPNGPLLAVLSTPGKSGANFELAYVDIRNQKVNTIGPFSKSTVPMYDGYDAALTFSDDGTEVWAVFAESFGSDGPTGGVFSVIDTKDASVKHTGKVSGLGPNQFVYGAFPSNDPSSFSGIIATQGNDMISLSFATMSFNGGGVSFNDGANANWAWGGGTPISHCNGVGFSAHVVSRRGENDDTITSQPFTIFDLKTGEIKQQVDLFDKLGPSDAWGFACL